MVPKEIQPFLDKVTEEFSINTKLRLAHFLAQAAHESNGFRVLEENLNYSAEGLLKTFPKYFPDKATALTYAHIPIAIASRVYANRLGNGDKGSGEGWRYRGRGYIQLTGKDNYRAFSDFTQIDFVVNPDLLLQPEFAMRSAGWFFAIVKNLNPIADKGAEEEIVREITKRINGGLNGIEDRLKRFTEFYQTISLEK